jgi:hypothetical protein
MDRSQEIKLLVRVAACEQLIQHLLFMVAKSGGDPVETLKDYRARVLDEYREATIKGADAATSDLLAQELYDALDTILSRVIARAQGGPPSS